MAQLIFIVAMFALLWLLLIRPQRKRQVEQQELQSSVEVGDEILTVGGFYGHVRELLDADDLLVEVAPGMNVRVARRAVAGIVEEEEVAAPEPDEPESDEPEAAEPEPGEPEPATLEQRRE